MAGNIIKTNYVIDIFHKDIPDNIIAYKKAVANKT